MIGLFRKLNSMPKLIPWLFNEIQGNNSNFKNKTEPNKQKSFLTAQSKDRQIKSLFAIINWLCCHRPRKCCLSSNNSAVYNSLEDDLGISGSLCWCYVVWCHVQKWHCVQSDYDMCFEASLYWSHVIQSRHMTLEAP